MKGDKNIKIKYSFIKVLTTSDLSRRRLPVMSIESINSGPVVWLTACAHGDEVSGMVIVQEIFKNLRKNLLKGAVYAFPLMNPIGFETSSRYITLSEEDLNRSFPGDKNGSLSERIADQIFATIVEKKPVLVLDLHNDWVRSIPYAFIDHSDDIINTETYKKTHAFSKHTGLLSVLDTDELEKTLSYNLIKKGVPALTLELGEPYVINETSVEIGVKCIMNILSSLGMIKPIEEVYKYSITGTLEDKILKYSFQSSSSSGIIRFSAKPGELVKKGQPVARIYNAFGRLEETINALNNGVVLGHSDYSVSFPGAAIISFGNF